MPLGFGKQRKHCRENQGGHKQNTYTGSVRRACIHIGHVVQRICGYDQQDQHDGADDECDEAVDPELGKITNMGVAGFEPCLLH